jgi:hypothetical protein
MSWFSKSKQCSSLFEAIAQNNAAEVARFLSQAEFTLIETTDDGGGGGGGGGKGAMVAEFDDVPVLVAFTSNDHAAKFAGANRDLLDASGELPAFVVGGNALLMYLPDGVGAVFNPESAQEQMMTPKLVRAVKSLLHA